MKKIILLIVSLSFLCSLSSCNEKTADSADSSAEETSVLTTEQTQETTAAKPVEEIDAATADKRAGQIYEAAQKAAEKYETAGAVLNATVITSEDASGSNAEKCNFINLMKPDIDFDGKWAIKIEQFKIISAVYCVSADTSVLGKYPDSFSGTLSDGRTGDDITSYLD